MDQDDAPLGYDLAHLIIGHHTVSHPAAHGAHEYICARSPDKGTAAITIKQTYPTSTNIDLVQRDLTNLTSPASSQPPTTSSPSKPPCTAQSITQDIMATPLELTKDRHEAQRQTNYLAHWVLTNHLLPLMLRTAKLLPTPGQRAHRQPHFIRPGHLGAPRDGIDFTDLSLGDAGTWQRYGQSKPANILHTKTLHKR
ncbi:hypothetical protein FQN50_008553 [Emmonsiellopsis sp. PD_5]|nr:hypothetical protein FQN50_008553 [Emmonsiellopsis sp. PD_5]